MTDLSCIKIITLYRLAIYSAVIIANHLSVALVFLSLDVVISELISVTFMTVHIMFCCYEE